MKPGDRVEVEQVWASAGPLRPPLRRWFGGYELVRIVQNQAIVRRDAGLFVGVETRWRLADVRKSP